MLQNFLLNILLTFIWVALTGQLDYTNFVFGYALGFFILWLVNRSTKASRDYFYRVPKIFAFILLFFYDLLKSNFEVMKDVLTPNYNMKPGIIKYEMKAKTDFEITMLANMVALTPGTSANGGAVPSRGIFRKRGCSIIIWRISASCPPNGFIIGACASGGVN